MTRRGSLAYYLAAWVVGCFSITVALWIKDIGVNGRRALTHNYVFDLFGFYFYTLMFGAVLTLLGAFLLRRAMATMRSPKAAHWMAAGAALAPALVFVASRTAHLLDRFFSAAGDRPYEALRFFVFTGAEVIAEEGWWLAIFAGAATAYVLHRIDRAFAPQSADASA